ncbi:MAG: hypothetical protein HPY67_04630 [Syntrophaceae bacterium]|nr:hypothetical protein [Syntrophaceae bacterium]
MIGRNASLPLSVRLIVILVFAAILLSGIPAGAAEVTLAWDPNAEPDLAGYKVYSGTASRNYSGTVDVGNWTRCVMGGLEPGRTYYFAAKAYNATGSESDYSAEVVYSVPAACSFSLSTGSQSFGPEGGTGSVSVSTASACSWSAVSGASWLTVTAGASGTGPGSVSFAVAANTASASRTATLSVGEQVLTVTQSGTAGPFTITSSAGPGGTISPLGTSTVAGGGSKTYTITPKTGYAVSSVQVDGVSVGAVSAYTFSAVNANHAIKALFKKKSRLVWW